MSEEGEVSDQHDAAAPMVAGGHGSAGSTLSALGEDAGNTRKRERGEDDAGASMAHTQSQSEGDSAVNDSEAVNNALGGRSRPKSERIIKILLSSTQAGALIGQGGAAVSNLQTRTGTRIKVSNKSSFFPGTQFRVITIEGGDDQIIEAMKTIVLDVCFMDTKVEGDLSECILAVPSSAAPILIGKQGARVNEINKETNCEVRIAKQAEEIPGIRERTVTLKGKKDQVLSAVLAVLDTMFKDASGRATSYDNRTTSYDVGGYRRDDYGRRDYRDEDRYRDRRDYRDDYRRDRDYRGSDRYDPRGPLPPPGFAPIVPGARDSYRDSRRFPEDRHPDDERRAGPPAPLMKPPAYSTQVSVPDEFVGAMLGRNGENLAEIQRVTRTRINVSRKGEFVPDTRDRIVTISGTFQDCEAAKTMLAAKITAKPA